MLDKVKGRLMQRYGPKQSGGTYERKVAAPAIETTEVHTYREEVQPVLLREDNEVEVRTTIQPILEDEQSSSEVIEDVEPLRFLDVQHTPDEEDKAIEESNREAMEALGGHEVEEQDVQVIRLGEVAETHMRRHVVEVIQPVIRRRVAKEHLTVRYQPRYERHSRVTMGVIREAEAITMDQWSRHASA